jgi:hypothetical protein
VLYRIPGERHIEMRKVYSGAGGLVMQRGFVFGACHGSLRKSGSMSKKVSKEAKRSNN